MRNDLDADAQLEVEITNLVATEAEIQNAQSLIESGLGSNISPILVTPDGTAKGGTRFEMTFRVFNPNRFRNAQIQEWLYEAGLVGWRLDATFVPPK
jgi:hypothetical protein